MAKATALRANASGLLVICDPLQTFINDEGVHLFINVKSDSGIDYGTTVDFAVNTSAAVIKTLVRDTAKAMVLQSEGTSVANANITYMNLPTS